MSVTTDLLNRVIEEMLPDTVRAEIVDGELIVNAASPFNRHALVVRDLRRAIGDVAELVELEMTTVSLPSTDEEFIPDLAYYRFDELDLDVWINPATALVMAVEVVSGKDNSTAAQRDRKHKTRSYAASGVPLYLLIDQPRKQVVLHSEPHFVPGATGSRYSRIVNITYGEPLELPEPFSRTIDTSIFER
ncbi:MAG TPA: Uma2 family endonuclease [Actinocrinis sp.]|uniref:Uma2 family endonuclease n=1 Tax=Actinocrinis sp. TaxID=1920516 RepID=UPI002DDD539F|nr:Uma2 family endonuclease [Actinocrinis sp.]HEV2347992.1 Uma2 family endonuclease [Actinocrinis sp.]